MKFIIIYALLLSSVNASFNYRNSSKLSPGDYLLKSRDRGKDPTFTNNSGTNLGVSFNIGSDCGRIDMKSTLRASLKNLLDSQYFGSLGKDILAGSPMLVTCYFSPTWCAILKHTKLTANFLSQLRLDQCSLIDKYTDSRTEDFYIERQGCVHRAIQRNGGNMEAAMKSCSNSQEWSNNFMDWTGRNRKVHENKLIESSAKWAGINSNEGNRIVNLTKSLVGDLAISKARVSLDYGPRKISFTPRTYYKSVKLQTKEVLDKLINKLERNLNRYPPEIVISNKDLENISGEKDNHLVDRQTLNALVNLPYKQQEIAINKLSGAIALTRFAGEMNKTLDVLHLAEQNPNLPDHKKREIRYKKDSLKSSVKLTLDLNRERNIPLNKVIKHINELGDKGILHKKQEVIRNDFGKQFNKQIKKQFWDCSDDVFCEE